MHTPPNYRTASSKPVAPSTTPQNSSATLWSITTQSTSSAPTFRVNSLSLSPHPTLRPIATMREDYPLAKGVRQATHVQVCIPAWEPTDALVPLLHLPTVSVVNSLPSWRTHRHPPSWLMPNPSWTPLLTHIRKPTPLLFRKTPSPGSMVATIAPHYRYRNTAMLRLPFCDGHSLLRYVWTRQSRPRPTTSAPLAVHTAITRRTVAGVFVLSLESPTPLTVRVFAHGTRISLPKTVGRIFPRTYERPSRKLSGLKQKRHMLSGWGVNPTLMAETSAGPVERPLIVPERDDWWSAP